MASGVYDLYSANGVFENKFANILCNQIMQALNSVGFDDFNQHFALTGEAANCYEKDSAGPIQQIQFATDEREIYLYIAKNLKEICPDLQLMEAYEQKIIAFFQGVCIEFIKESSISTKEVLGIYITA